MNKFWYSTVGWGLFLWLVGYLLGIILFAFVNPEVLGWVIMPIGIIMTTWVLTKKIRTSNLSQAIVVGIIWAITAIICDYFFLVQLFHPADGYYKLDVYLYYLITLCLPIAFGKKKFQPSSH